MKQDEPIQEGQSSEQVSDNGLSEAANRSLAALSGLKTFDTAIKELEPVGKTQFEEANKGSGEDLNKGRQGPKGQPGEKGNPVDTGKQGGEEGDGKKDPEAKNEGNPEGDNKPDGKKTGKEIEFETPLFGKRKLGAENKNQELNLDTFSEKQNEYAKATFGVDSMEKVLKELAPKWRVQAEAAKTYEKKVKEFENFMTKLPDKLFNAIKAYDEGRDFEAELSNSTKLNFNKKLEDQSVESLLNNYYPGKFSKEDLDMEVENEKRDLALDAAKKLYLADKTSFDNKIRASVENQTKAREAYEKSIVSSVDHLQKTLPLINELAVNEVSESLKGGAQGILGEFFNEDGSLKEDAAQKMAMVKHGMATLNAYMKLAERQGATEVLEEIVERSPDKLQAANQSGNGASEKKVKEAIGVLHGVNRGHTY